MVFIVMSLSEFLVYLVHFFEDQYVLSVLAFFLNINKSYHFDELVPYIDRAWLVANVTLFLKPQQENII